MNCHAIDISKHQARYSPLAGGVKSVVMRIAYGTKKDVCFDEFVNAARAANVQIGFYGFATWHYKSLNGCDLNTARRLMQQQIDAWIAILHGVHFTGWLAIDQELERGCEMGLSKGDNTALLNEAIERLNAAGYGGRVCVYCSASWVPAHFTDSLAAPYWLAYYYADPNDPDFSGVPQDPGSLGTKWGNYMKSLGKKLIGWQFGRIGYGGKYGVGSANVDRNIFYRYPDTRSNGGNTMKFLSVFGEKNCQCFTTTDVNAVDTAYNGGRLMPGVNYPLMAELGADASGFSWVRIFAGGENRHAVVLPDRCSIIELSPGDAVPAVIAQGAVSGDVEALRKALAEADEKAAHFSAVADKAVQDAAAAAACVETAKRVAANIKESAATICAL